jgi:hypothetical protein
VAVVAAGSMTGAGVRSPSAVGDRRLAPRGQQFRAFGLRQTKAVSHRGDQRRTSAILPVCRNFEDREHQELEVWDRHRRRLFKEVGV